MITVNDIKKLYPQFKEENMNFYAKILAQQKVENLGIVNKDIIMRRRNLEAV